MMESSRKRNNQNRRNLKSVGLPESAGNPNRVRDTYQSCAFEHLVGHATDQRRTAAGLRDDRHFTVIGESKKWVTPISGAMARRQLFPLIREQVQQLRCMSGADWQSPKCYNRGGWIRDGSDLR